MTIFLTLLPVFAYNLEFVQDIARTSAVVKHEANRQLSISGSDRNVQSPALIWLWLSHGLVPGYQNNSKLCKFD